MNEMSQMLTTSIVLKYPFIWILFVSVLLSFVK